MSTQKIPQRENDRREPYKTKTEGPKKKTNEVRKSQAADEPRGAKMENKKSLNTWKQRNVGEEGQLPQGANESIIIERPK